MYVGRYKKSSQGGNSPNDIIDSKLKPSGSMFFPEDIGVHQFMMIFHEYNFDQEKSIMKESIVLPIPSTLIDKYGMTYNSQDLKTLGAAGASFADDVLDSFKKAGTPEGEAKEADRKAGLDINALTAKLGTGAAAAARDFLPDEVENPLAIATGTVANPHTSLLFSSVALKVFDFNWKLYPRSVEESNKLKEIIRVIKQRSHPSFTGMGEGADSNFIMKYPHEVDLYYLGNGDSMHRFKRAAITGLEVNYTPEGGPAFFQNTGNPVFTELKMTFTETQIWTAEDFAEETIASAGNQESVG